MTPTDKQAAVEAALDVVVATAVLCTTTRGQEYERACSAYKDKRAALLKLLAEPRPEGAPDGWVMALRAVELGEEIYQRAHDGEGPMNEWWHAPTCELHRIHNALAAAPSPTPAPTGDEPRGFCSWKYDQDGFWLQGCGGTWAFTEGAMADNSCHYCPSCGKRIDAITHADEGGK